jgi:hypothetical protein
MSIKKSIWGKTLVQSFYREQAGFFLFVFLVFFGVVQPSTQLYFHYALIRGILETPALMLLVAVAWALYGLRVRRFIVQTLEAPDALFLYKANALPPRQLMTQCVKVIIALLGPVIGYAGIIVAVAIARKAPGKGLEVAVYVVLMIAVLTWEMRWRTRYPGDAASGPFRNSGGAKTILRGVPYWSILLRFLFTENKGVLAAVKIFSVGMLYLLLRLQTPDDYDLRMPFLVYSLALFGHGILLFRCRRLETTRLLFYRALPVNAIRRASQYAVFCIILLLPEMIGLGWLTPHPIKPIDAAIFAAGGYGILLALNSILLARTLTAAEYCKLCLVFFGILYVVVLKTWG